MVRMETRNFSQEEWHEITSQFDDVNLIQLWEYGEVKARLQGWRVVRHVWYDGDIVMGAAQAMVKLVPFIKKGGVWINRAPLWQRRGQSPDLSMLNEMLRTLKLYWVDERKMYLRIAPTLLDDEKNRTLLANAGFSAVPDSQWISARIDLRQSDDALRENLRSNWRNHLAQAERSGILYYIDVSSTLFDELVCEYRKFLLKKRLYISVTPEFIARLQSTLPQDRKMWIISGRINGKFLGAILLARYGKSVEYLVGVVNDEGKKFNAAQYLLWYAIIESKKRGIQWFDVGGAHPQKTPTGILHFKEGLGGVPYRLIGEFEAVSGIRANILRLLIKFRRQ